MQVCFSAECFFYNASIYDECVIVFIAYISVLDI